MSLRKKLVVAFFALCLAAAAVYAFLTTLVFGRTDGPDLVESLRSSRLKAGAIISIEVVQPRAGHNPFTASEYAALRRTKTIVSPAEIRGICDSLVLGREGYPHMNHPGTTWSAYLRVNTAAGHHWVYCDVLDDGHRHIFSFDANTLGATNPNGSNPYYLESFESLFLILGSPAADDPRERAPR